MSLSDNIKTSFYAGIGLMLKGKEKVEEAAREFAKDQKLAAEEGEKFVKEAINKANETKEEIEKFVDKRTKETIEKMGLVTRDEYEALKKQYESIKMSYDELREYIKSLDTNDKRE